VISQKITWWQAAEILGFSDRHLRRIRERYEQFGYESLFDNWAYQPSYVSSTPWFFNGLRIQWFPTDKLKIEHGSTTAGNRTVDLGASQD